MPETTTANPSATSISTQAVEQGARKFSPGEWAAECVGATSAGPDGVDVYEVNNGYKRIAEFMTEADARLLAASKDMLATLLMVRTLDDAYGIDFTEQQRDQLHDAIRKAGARS
jgi:hypothetical protein